MRPSNVKLCLKITHETSWLFWWDSDMVHLFLQSLSSNILCWNSLSYVLILSKADPMSLYSPSVDLISVPSKAMLTTSPLSNATQAPGREAWIVDKACSFLYCSTPSIPVHIPLLLGPEGGVREKDQKPLAWLALLVPLCILCSVNNQLLALSLLSQVSLGREQGVLLTHISVTEGILSGFVFSGFTDFCNPASHYLGRLTSSAALLVWVPSRRCGYCRQCAFYPPKGH